MFRSSVAVLGSLALLAACAPRPGPVVSEPIYDKFGNPEDVCVSDEQMREPTYVPPLRPLPRCEERCEPGEQPTFTIAGQWPVCVPRPEDDNDPDPRSPNSPTFG